MTLDSFLCLKKTDTIQYNYGAIFGNRLETGFCRNPQQAAGLIYFG